MSGSCFVLFALKQLAGVGLSAFRRAMSRGRVGTQWLVCDYERRESGPTLFCCWRRRRRQWRHYYVTARAIDLSQQVTAWQSIIVTQRSVTNIMSAGSEVGVSSDDDIGFCEFAENRTHNRDNHSFRETSA